MKEELTMNNNKKLAVPSVGRFASAEELLTKKRKEIADRVKRQQSKNFISDEELRSHKRKELAESLKRQKLSENVNSDFDSDGIFNILKKAFAINEELIEPLKKNTQKMYLRKIMILCRINVKNLLNVLKRGNL
jgi:hypothetical protein